MVDKVLGIAMLLTLLLSVWVCAPAASSAARALIPPSAALCASGPRMEASVGLSQSWPPALPPSRAGRARLPSPASLVRLCGESDRNALLQECALLRDQHQVMDQHLVEASTHVVSTSLTLGGRGAGRRPLFLASCGGQGVARATVGEPPGRASPVIDGAGPHVGQVLHARSAGVWRPLEVLLRCPDPQYFLARWWHDSSLSVLPVAETVCVPDRGALCLEVGADSRAGRSLPGPRPVSPLLSGGPPLVVGQAVFAKFDGEWHLGYVRQLLSVSGKVQILWASEYAKTNVPVADVRPAFD